MPRSPLTYISDSIANQWKGFILGILASLAASYLYAKVTSYTDDATYRRDASHELATRLLRTQQAITLMVPIPGSAGTALANVETFYSNTKSETANPRFEGQRVENIIYNLKRISDDSMAELLDPIRYIQNDTFFIDNEFQQSSKQEPRIRAIERKFLDYRCCLSLKTGQDDLGCTGEYSSGLHYCFYADGTLKVAPERMQFQRYADGTVRVVPEQTLIQRSRD